MLLSMSWIGLFLVEGEHADIRMAMNLYVHNSEEEKFKGIKSLKNFSD